MTERLLVSVVDDDESVRESLPDLLEAFGYSARAFSSAQEFFESDALDRTAILILDIAMPAVTGIELQAELKRRGSLIPIIFITANWDERTCSHVREQGAVACLAKPFSDKEIRKALKAARK